jgi:hypothetical protein
MKKRGGRNANRDFRGEKRTIDIHCSTTDPDARLRRAAWSMALEGVGLLNRDRHLVRRQYAPTSRRSDAGACCSRLMSGTSVCPESD